MRRARPRAPAQIVAELKARPSSPRQSAELEALLSKLDADVRHAMLRAQAASLAPHQRLEERTAILQRNFARIVELLNEPAGTTPASPAPAAGGAAPGGGGGSPALATGHAASANGAANSSPLAATAHPWSGGAYTAPGASPAARPRSSPGAPSPAGATPSQPGGPRRYDSFPSLSVAASPSASSVGNHQHCLLYTSPSPRDS